MQKQSRIILDYPWDLAVDKPEGVKATKCSTLLVAEQVHNTLDATFSSISGVSNT